MPPRSREADRIQKAILSFPWPRFVKAMVFEFEDGDDSLNISVIVTDGAPRTSDWAEKRAKVRDRIRAALDKRDVERWAFVRFRTQAQQDRLDEESED